jgi:pyruvate dehydrogenase E1 component alpha subunit
MYGIQVDGNDVMAMYEATKAALDRAREGGGASLIEAVTYRMGDHTTADDASRYRDAAEVEKWKAYDPLLRLERYLRKRSQLDDAMLADMERTISAQIAQVVSERDAMPKSKATDTFLYMYEEMPLHLKLQMAEMEESL